MKKRYFITGIILSFLFVSSLFQTVHAKKTVSDAGSLLNTVVGQTGVSKNDVPTISGEIIKNFLQLAGLIFLILMVYAGFRWMNAQGNDEEVTTARKTIIMVSIGIVVVAGSYAITNFVTNRLVEGSPNEGGFVDLENADYTNLGCCLDKVRRPGNPGELRATSWGRRIASQGDCEEQGKKPTSFDEIYGTGTWHFYNVDSKQQCDSLYELFCEETECYDLGF